MKNHIDLDCCPTQTDPNPHSSCPAKAGHPVNTEVTEIICRLRVYWIVRFRGRGRLRGHYLFDRHARQILEPALRADKTLHPFGHGARVAVVHDPGPGRSEETTC